MKPLKNVNKLDLKIIIAIAILISLFSIIFFNLQFGPARLGSQLMRLGITCFLCYFLYQEKQWARWVFVVVGFLGGVSSLLGGLTLLLLQEKSPQVSALIIILALGLFYLASAIYLAFIRKWPKSNS